MADYLQWIRDGLKQPGKTQSGLARAFGREPSAITNMLKGARALKTHEIEKAARYLGVSPPSHMATAAEGADAASVRLIGYVGAATEAHYYELPPDELDRVPAPFGAGPNTVAVEIRGDSLGPAFNRWLVFYDDVKRPITEEMVGQLCVVGLADERTLIKIVQNATKQGRFNLVSNVEGQPSIKNVAVDWAARVRGIFPPKRTR